MSYVHALDKLWLVYGCMKLATITTPMQTERREVLSITDPGLNLIDVIAKLMQRVKRTACRTKLTIINLINIK